MVAMDEERELLRELNRRIAAGVELTPPQVELRQDLLRMLAPQGNNYLCAFLIIWLFSGDFIVVLTFILSATIP